jgi:hypothetical protein
VDPISGTWAKSWCHPSTTECCSTLLAPSTGREPFHRRLHLLSDLLCLSGPVCTHHKHSFASQRYLIS